MSVSVDALEFCFGFFAQHVHGLAYCDVFKIITTVFMLHNLNIFTTFISFASYSMFLMETVHVIIV